MATWIRGETEREGGVVELRRATAAATTAPFGAEDDDDCGEDSGLSSWLDSTRQLRVSFGSRFC
ncbi:hypothetical protein Hanom_Chr16g01461961 [Helianthus anomalus]